MINRSLFSHAIDVFKKILKCTDKDEAAVLCLKNLLKDYMRISEEDAEACLKNLLKDYMRVSEEDAEACLKDFLNDFKAAKKECAALCLKNLLNDYKAVKDEDAVLCLKNFLKDYKAINEADIDALWIAALSLRNFHLALHFDATFSYNAGYTEECRYILNTVDFDALLEELLNAAFAVSNKEEYERRRIEFCKDYQDSLLCVLKRYCDNTARRADNAFMLSDVYSVPYINNLLLKPVDLLNYLSDELRAVSAGVKSADLLNYLSDELRSG